MTRKEVLAALATEQPNARYVMRPINNDTRTSVFDRSINAFIPIGAIPGIDPTEAYEEGAS